MRECAQRLYDEFVDAGVLIDHQYWFQTKYYPAESPEEQEEIMSSADFEEDFDSWFDDNYEQLLQDWNDIQG